MRKTEDSILDEAKEITGGDRMEQYGHPRENFRHVARLWNAHLLNRAVDIDSKDVAIMMTLFKIARETNGHKRDNLVDAAGYIRNCAQIEGIE